MALAKLCAFCVIISQIQGRHAAQIFFTKNPNTDFVKKFIQPSQQNVGTCNKGQNVTPLNNNRIIAIQRQHNVGSSCANNIPLSVTHNYPTMSTPQPSVTIVPGQSNGICSNNNPTSVSVKLTPADASTLSTLLAKSSSCNNMVDLQFRPQNTLHYPPQPFQSSNQIIPTNSPVTLTSPPPHQVTIQSQPIQSCPPTQSSLPVHISIDETSSNKHHQCTGGQNTVPQRQGQPYVIVKQIPTQQAPNSIRPIQEAVPLPVPLAPVPIQNQQSNQAPNNAGSIQQLLSQGPQSTNLKRLLPLLANLLKSKGGNANCGCQNQQCSSCGQQNGGYNNVYPMPVFNIEEEEDPFVFPGVFHGRGDKDKVASEEDEDTSMEDESSEKS